MKSIVIESYKEASKGRRRRKVYLVVFFVLLVDRIQNNGHFARQQKKQPVKHVVCF